MKAKNILILLIGLFILTGCSDEYKIRQFGGDPINLPPDPGLAGKRTLEGIDANNNGVRDDLERAIYFKYPKDKEKRQILYQIAKSRQAMLVVGAAEKMNEVAVADVMDKMARASSCKIVLLEEKGEENLYIHDFGIFIENLVINTQKRYKAWRGYEEKAAEVAVFTPKAEDDISDCDLVGD